jgi:hypothetical protein|tara:strand:- start:32437 stop:32667 length:231 start_codon:yes stop_codon:yes gene_type:complete
MTKSNAAHPSVNVDGTPMVPGSSVDVKGNVFGITEDTSSSMFEDSSSSFSGMDSSCDSSFDSDFGCDFDSSFDSDF